jgi:hypothetical protein
LDFQAAICLRPATLLGTKSLMLLLKWHGLSLRISWTDYNAIGKYHYTLTLNRHPLPWLLALSNTCPTCRIRYLRIWVSN